MKDWKYFLYIGVAFGIFIALKLASPKKYDWTITYSPLDKNPYGAFALNELLPSIFPGQEIHHSHLTLYEIKDSLKKNDNVLIVSSGFSADKEDTDVLLEHVGGGGTVLISAQYFWGHFSDTVDVATYDYFFRGEDIIERKDTAALRFAAFKMDTTTEYYYRRDNIHNYFNRFDSTRTTVIAKNDRGMPVTIRIKWGKGSFILNCTPLIFTNIYLLARDNHEFVTTTLSYLDLSPVQWTEYYHVGRMESQTPLRFILSNESLRWAYYITIVSILIFIGFEMKRKQRIIPVIAPLENTTLEFVGTISNLYYQSAEHKNIAEKKIHFLMDKIRTKYWLNTNVLNEPFIIALAGKSGKPEDDVRALINLILAIQEKEKISSEELIDINKKIEKFNNK
ncbi:MAG TPA: DUF4350 domain-containing protein [Chryseolinea sp.]|nr:DUF4350 domain-containing protein [Chryseolinea sp.]